MKLPIQILLLALYSLLFFQCKERTFNNPFDSESIYYVGDDNSIDEDENGIADILEPTLNLVPGKCFLMGSDAINRPGLPAKEISDDEQPSHEVCVDSFFMGTTEVSFGEFRTVFFERDLDVSKDEFPVVNITWFEAVEYCNKLSEIHGFENVYKFKFDVMEVDITKNGFRLPTEAEWELAYGGDSLNIFYWGSDSSLVDKNAWYLGNSEGETHPAKKKFPNEHGLYDMSGNVWEWVNDLYDENYFSDSPKFNPQGPHNATPDSGRVFKGGGYNYDRFALRRTNRSHLNAKDRHKDLGFRIVRPSLF